MELRNLFQYIQQDVGDCYSPFCRATLGAGQCYDNGNGVDLADYTCTGTVETVTDQKTIICTDISPALPETDYFTYGVLTWTSGGNNGKRAQVRTHTYDTGDHTIELEHAMLYTIEIGDSFSVSAGCDHEISGDCLSRFDNVVNFQGEPYVPGRGVLTPMEMRF
jgi:uncharacterized phage protein (TIGR02218 family)